MPEESKGIVTTTVVYYLLAQATLTAIYDFDLSPCASGGQLRHSYGNQQMIIVNVRVTGGRSLKRAMKLLNHMPFIVNRSF